MNVFLHTPQSFLILWAMFGAIAVAAAWIRGRWGRSGVVWLVFSCWLGLVFVGFAAEISSPFRTGSILELFSTRSLFATTVPYALAVVTPAVPSFILAAGVRFSAKLAWGLVAAAVVALVLPMGMLYTVCTLEIDCV